MPLLLSVQAPVHPQGTVWDAALEDLPTGGWGGTACVLWGPKNPIGSCCKNNLAAPAIIIQTLSFQLAGDHAQH